MSFNEQKIGATFFLAIIFLAVVFSSLSWSTVSKVYAQIAEGIIMTNNDVNSNWLERQNKLGFNKLDLKNLKFLLAKLKARPPIFVPVPPGPLGYLPPDPVTQQQNYQAQLKSYEYYVAQIETAIKQLEEAKKSNWQKLKEFAKKLYDEAIVSGGKILYKNALRALFSRLAYQSAVYLASGDVGKKPLFDEKTLPDFLRDVADVTLANTLDLLASTNGFYQFDVCEPGDVDLKLAIYYSMFGNFNGRGPASSRCTFREIAERWDEWAVQVGRTYSTDNFLTTMKSAFKPKQTDVGIYLSLDSSIRSRLVDEQTKRMFDYVNRESIKPLTEPITGFIRTPEPIVKEGAKALATQGPVAETIHTNDIIADSIGIFTNTLAAKLIEQLYKKGLTSGKRAQTTMAFNWVNDQVQRAKANQVFANLAEVNYTSVRENIIESLGQCQNPQNPGPTECVMNPKLTTAVEEELTVAQALANGQLRADGLVGYKANGQLTYLNDYPYRSLVIMRIHRIVPAAWELAALYNIKVEKEVTLKRIIDCYEDKLAPGDPTKPEGCLESDLGYNPYYHLIDPNWILKAPNSYCLRQGIGSQFISTSLECSEDNVFGTTDPENNNELVEGPACETRLNNPDRPVLSVVRNSDYCADRQTCLFENAKGECTGEYGYCLKEQDLWRFPEAKSCQPQYNTCEALTRTVDNKNFSYLRNTLEPCSANDAGCLWYSTLQSKVAVAGQVVWQWQEDNKIYLNGQTKYCDAREGGCSKLTRMIPGVNNVVNGDFSFALDGAWQGANCEISQAAAEGISGAALKMAVEREAACSALIAGFIPVDPQYSYVLTGAYKSPDIRQASVRVNYYTAAGGNGSEVLNENLDRPGSSWKYFSYEINNLNLAARYLKVILGASGNNGDFYFDDVQLVINRSPIVRDNLSGFAVKAERYQTDYSHNESYARSYLKQAPDYLGCDLYNEVDRNPRYLILNEDGENEEGIRNCVSDGKYWRADIGQCVRGGDASCSSYAAVCRASEVGCQGYKPLNNDPEVSAVAGQGDICPSECVGYDSYLELPGYFDKIENPEARPQTQDFIPQTAQECRAVDSGCEQFTNLDEVASGGEGIEYFTELRQCVSPNNANIRTYYTWEGSDTTGYQLKKWEFLGSNFDAGPCTNISIGSEQCADTQNNIARCAQADIDAGNADCRDFFNKDNEHFFTLQSRAIASSTSCRPYRRTLTGQIYNADPSEGKTCSAAVNNCKEYKGNAGNNVKNILTDNFERNSVGDWQNGLGSVAGLTISNEAIYQGGHSLQAAISNNLVAYPLAGKLTAGKDYLLSFWIKKSRGQKVNSVDPAQENLLAFALNGANLSGDWILQTVGPVEFATSDDSPARMVLTVQNLGADEVFYLDNVVLKEFTNSFYAIKNSWTTPVSCDTPNHGAFLGCQAYLDRQQQTRFLKGFSNLCSSSAIGCEAFLDTRNSTAFQGAHQYNDQTSVPNDRVVYLVNDPAKQCTAEKQGCMLLGQPILDRQASEQGVVIGYNNTYKINNPDLYGVGQGNILCNPEALFCSKFQGEVSGERAFYDPQLASASAENTVKGCYYSGNGWYKNGSQNEPCPGAYQSNGVNYLPSFTQPNYQGWVGACPSNQSTCTEFRDPQSPVSEEVSYCDARLSPAWQDQCVVGQNGAENNDGYCNLPINGVRHNVCVLSGNSCEYSNSGWTCLDSRAVYNNEGRLISGGNCEIDLANNQKLKVCFIPADSATATCQYSLLCQSDQYYYLKNTLDKQATCTEVDRSAGCLLFNDTSNGNLIYSNRSSKNGAQAEAGSSGAPFGNPAYQDANLLLKVSRGRQCGEWLECKTGFEQPKASASGGSEFVCLDLYRCGKKGDGDNECAKIVTTAAGEQPVFDLSDDDEATQVDQIKNLSGFSHPGLKWNNSIQTIGYRSPEQLTQRGSPIAVVNGGFETYLGSDLSKPEGWQPKAANDGANVQINGSYRNSYCEQILDGTPANIHSGHYSLKINLKGGENTQCPYLSKAGNSAGFYPISPANNYNLSFYAKSENGGQIGRAGLAWYKLDNAGNPVLCGPPDYCGIQRDPPIPDVSGPTGAFLARVNAPANKWQKYILAVGPGTDRPIPPEATLAKIYLYNLKVNDRNHGSIWYDDFAIEPVLDLGNNRSLAKDCRLYPTEEAPSCSYQGLSSKYEGWQGYCLEPDPAYQLDPTNPNNYQNCLQWYPVDSLLGDRLSVFNTQNIGYTDRSPLYYCAQTEGKYNWLPDDNGDGNPDVAIRQTKGYKYQSRINYGYNVHNDNEFNQCGGFNERPPDQNINLCLSGDVRSEWESRCKSNWGCGEYDETDCRNNQNCAWTVTVYNGCSGNYNPSCDNFDNISDCRAQNGCSWSGGRCHRTTCSGLDESACNENNGCSWNGNDDSCSGNYQFSCSGFNQATCLSTDGCSQIPTGVCQASKTDEQCAQYPADACPAGCVYDDTQRQNREIGAELFADGNVWYDHNNLTLDEIGAIYFEVTDTGGGFAGKGGFLSDITDQLDSVELEKDYGYYKKFKKVFHIREEADTNMYSVVLAYGPDTSGVDRLLRFEFFAYDHNQSGGMSGQLYYYLKDKCSLIAQTVKLEGGVVKEKSWLGRFTNWTDSISNVLGFGKKTAEQPYGSFYPPKNSTPEYWSEPGQNDRKDAPLYVYSGGSFDFGPSAGTPWSVPELAALVEGAPGRICVSSSNTGYIGKECKSSDNCGAGGVCAGIGKFCYNDQGLSDGKPCLNNSDCGTNMSCRYLGNVENPAGSLLAAQSKAEAVGRLQDLFAKVYGVWQWDNQTGKYESCNDGGLPGETSCGLDGFIADKSGPNPPAGWVRSDIPYAVAEGDWAPGQPAGTLSVPGGKVQLKFTANGSPEQLPIEGIWISWNDGNVDYFKGPLGYKPNPALPYSAYHIYTCKTNDRGDRCMECGGSGTLNNGRCEYNPPTINFKDHWGWCANNGESSWVDEAACNHADGKPADKGIVIE